MNLQGLKNEIPDIFEKVKNDVKKVLGRHRAGLSLGLVEMGMYNGGFIGGFFISPGTNIVMNKTPLMILLKNQSNDIIWAYIYHILLHEYIHSLGVLNEHKCQAITLRVSEKIFKDSDPALILAKNGIATYFPNLNIIYAPPNMTNDGIKIESISGFDKYSYDYYS